jgi:predicted lipid-binding transport protein (Tim44 family)
VKSLMGTMIAIIAFFLLIILVLGAQFGGIEIIVWLAALTASIFFAVRHHKRKRQESPQNGSV